jgi:hypothetical protein
MMLLMTQTDRLVSYRNSPIPMVYFDSSVGSFLFIFYIIHINPFYELISVPGSDKAYTCIFDKKRSYLTL